MAVKKYHPMTEAQLDKELAKVDMAVAEDFVRKAIISGRTGSYKGVHSVYSGFNGAVKSYLKCNPVALTTRLANQGKIAVIPRKNGVAVYLPEDAPKQGIDNSGNALLTKMGIKL